MSIYDSNAASRLLTLRQIFQNSSYQRNSFHIYSHQLLKLRNFGFKSINISTLHSINFLSTFIELKCRHASNLTFRSCFLIHIDINLHKINICDFISQFGKLRSNKLAWTTLHGKKYEIEVTRSEL